MAYTVDQLTQMGAKPVTAPTPAPAKATGKSYTAAQLQQMGAKPVTTNQSTLPPPAPKSFGQKLGDFAGGTVNAINAVGKATGITSLAALPVQLLAKGLGQPDPYAKGIGATTGPIKPASVTTFDGKTNGQFASEEAGNALQAASLFFPYGKAAGLAEKGLAPVLGETLGKFGAKVASGAAGGYGIDVGANLQSGKPLDQSLSPGLGTVIGGGLPFVPPVIGAAARGVGESLGVSTGAGYGAIKEAFQAASAGGERAKAYTDALRGKTTPEAIVEDAKDSLGTIIADRSKSYQDQLAKVTANNTKSFDISPVQTKLDSMLKDFNVEKHPETGALDFSRSPGLGRYKADLGEIQDVLDNWGSKPGDRTVVGIDKLKQTLDDFRRGTADSRKFDTFVTSLRNKAQDIIRKEPGYAKLVGDYSEKTGLIKDIQKALSLGDKASIDTGFRKLTTALRTNNEFRKELIGELDKASGGFLSSKIAGQQLSEALPRGLARQIEGFGAAGAVISGVGIIPLLKVAAFASPRIVGEIVNALGLSKSVFTQLLDHLGAQTAQFPGDHAVDEAGPAVKNYLAKNPPSLGLAMKDVNKMGPEELGALPKAVGDSVRAAPAKPDAFQGFEDITTTLLDDLKGRSTVSKQYVLDALNRSNIKQAEKDIIKPVLDQEGPTITVKDFANKVKSELLPLERSEGAPGGGGRYEGVVLPDDVRGNVETYNEHIYNSPIKTSAGNVHFGREAGSENYFAHTRTEDLVNTVGDTKSLIEDVKNDPNWVGVNEFSKENYIKRLQSRLEGEGKETSTRRVLEVQSDLFQRGRLENEQRDWVTALEDAKVQKYLKSESQDRGLSIGAQKEFLEQNNPKLWKEANDKIDARNQELKQKLKPYSNGWQDRIVREEVKQAAIDGKTKLQFPTGDTAMKIEGLGGNEGVSEADAGQIGDTFDFQGSDWTTVDNYSPDGYVSAIPTKDTRSFTLGDVQSERALELADDGGTRLFDELNNSGIYSRVVKGDPELEKAYDFVFKDTGDLSDDAAKSAFFEKFDVDDLAQRFAEQELKTRSAAIDYLNDIGTDESFVGHGHNDFEIIAYDPDKTEGVPVGDGEIDPNHPIHKYYEKELGKFLQKKYNAERITDPQGQTWWEVNVPEAAAKLPVQAFGKAKIGALVGGAAASAATAGALSAQPQPLSR